jgi:dUTPase
MVINRICRVQVQLATRLEDTARSTGGFGHTGV